MTHSQPLTGLDLPRPGDVVFVYSGGRDAVGSCLLQRFLLSPSVGPWFSHVAIVLSNRLAIEASTAPDAGNATWSGSILGEGVRLQLVPDLVIGAAKYSVLRHPDSPDLTEQFGVHTPYVSFILGSGYSTKSLVDDARSGHMFLDALLPEDWFAWSAEPDVIAKALRDNSQLRSGIMRHLRDGEALASLNDYFCSQLVATLLACAGLWKASSVLETPCTLHDALVAGGWQPVTDTAYGPEAISRWNRQKSEGEDWGLAFRTDLAWANTFRDLAHSGPMIDSLTEMHHTFGRHVETIRRTLDAHR